MASRNFILTFCLTASFLLTATSGLVKAQEGTGTPDGNTLKRSSYYGVHSNIPAAVTATGGIRELELPCTAKGEEIITHTGYSLLYDPKYKQARWVAYELTADETTSVVERNNHFMPDPKVKAGSSSNADYLNSGYDRGHLAPAADMSYSEKTMEESFYLSNMSPQKPGFNRGIWKDLETQVRNWAKIDSALYIVSGGVFADNLPTIGPGHVAVPKYYYKVVLIYHGKDEKGIGFVIPNEKSGKRLTSFVVSIDSVERLTGLNFFCRLPDDAENRIEAHADTTRWSWSPGAHKKSAHGKN